MARSSVNGDGAGAEIERLRLATGSSGSRSAGLEIRDFCDGAGFASSRRSNTIMGNLIHAVLNGVVVAGAAPPEPDRRVPTPARATGSGLSPSTVQLDTPAAGTCSRVTSFGLDDTASATVGDRARGRQARQRHRRRRRPERPLQPRLRSRQRRGRVDGVGIGIVDRRDVGDGRAGNSVGTDRAGTATELGNSGRDRGRERVRQPARPG